MADLDFNQASQPVQIVGGDEIFAADINANKDLNTSNEIKTEGVYGNVLIQSNNSVEVKVGATILANRKVLTLFNNSNRTYYWGFNSSVTTANGLPIPGGSEKTWLINDVVSIWVISDGGNNNSARVAEAR